MIFRATKSLVENTIKYNFIAKLQMHKEYVTVPSKLIHTLTPVTHTHAHTHTQTHTRTQTCNSKIVKVVQRVDLIRLNR